MRQSYRTKRNAKFLLSIVLCIGILFTALAGFLTINFSTNKQSVYADPSGYWTDGGNYDTTWYDASLSTFVLDDTVENDIVTVSIEKKLAGLASLVNAGTNFSGKTVKLNKNVDLSGHYWTPIGISNTFQGTFDGQNHTIDNMVVSVSAANSGFFGNISNYAYVMNVRIKDTCSVTSTSSVTGGVVGLATNSTIVNVVNEARVDGKAKTGGIVGSPTSTQIVNAMNAGTITGTTGVGGIAGDGVTPTIINSYNKGSVTGSGNNVGGIEGNDTGRPIIINSLNVGAISGKSYTAAIQGYCGWVAVTNCFYLEGTASKGLGRDQDRSEYNVEKLTDEQIKSDYIVTELNSYVNRLNANCGYIPLYNWTGVDSDHYPEFSSTPIASRLSLWTDVGNYDVTWYTSHTSDSTYIIDDTIVDGVVTISAEKKLAGLAVIVNGQNGVSTYNFSGKTIKLGRDIDLSGHGWMPIGVLMVANRTFNGTFDGEDPETGDIHVISNAHALMVAGSIKGSYYGFFGSVSSAQIKNVEFTATCSTFSPTNDSAGGVAGYGSLIATNVIYRGHVEGRDRSAGIMGRSSGSCQLTNVHNYGTIYGRICVGGLMGSVESSDRITNSHNEGTIVGIGDVTGKDDSCVGGLAGGKNAVTIINSYNSGNISGSGAVGGIVGRTTGSISNVYNTGTVTISRGTGSAGGIVGNGAAAVVNGFFLDTSEYGIGSSPSSTSCTKCTEAKMKGESGADANIVDTLNAYVEGNVTLFNWKVEEGEFPELIITDIIILTDTWTDSGNYNTSWYTGHESDTLYIINDTIVGGNVTVTAESKLAGLAYLVNVSNKNFSGKTIRLARNLDLSGHYWTPIGNAGSRKFYGTFDGNDKTISNMLMNRTAEYSGLFGNVSDAYIHNISFNNTCYVFSSTTTVGGLAGYINNSTVENITNAGRIIGTDNVGGIIGTANYSLVSESINTGKIQGRDNVGGIVGNSNYSTVKEITLSAGNITGRGRVGGIVGLSQNTASMINETSFNGTVSGTERVGGIVGYSYYARTINSYNAGTVMSHNTTAGGIVGYGEYGLVMNTYNLGSVTGANTDIGGIVGYDSVARVYNSYNVGSVTGTTNVGAILGSYTTSYFVNNCFYLETTASYGIGKNSLNDGCTSCSEATMKGSAGSGSNIVDALNAYVADREMLLNWAVDGDYPEFGTKTISYYTSTWTNPGNYDTSWYVGHESDDLFVIDDTIVGETVTVTAEAKLAGLAYLVNNNINNFVGKTIRLARNVDLSGHYWIPIGNSDRSFRGTFDGNNKTVSNMYVFICGPYRGFFGNVNNADIHDLTFSSTCQLYGTGDYLGGAIGYANNSTINNVSFAGRVDGYNNVGGILGYGTYSTIYDVTSSATVVGQDTISGVVGYNNYSTMYDILSSATVSGRNRISGIVGNLNDGTINRVSFSGTASGQDKVGGIVGHMSYGRVLNSYNEGAITSSNIDAGGIVGYGDYGIISNTYNLGSVTGSSNVGGIQGLNTNARIYNSYNAGALSGTSNVGGILGDYGGSYLIDNCFYLEAVDLYGIGRISSNDGCTPCSEAKMKGASGSGNNIVDSLNAYVDGNVTLINWVVDGDYPEFGNKVIIIVKGYWTDTGNYNTAWFDNAEEGQTLFVLEDTIIDGKTVTVEEQLAGLAYLVNSKSKTFIGMTIKLSRDIDLSAHYWVPIGSESRRFKGEFDGNDTTVSYMIFSRGATYSGLFGYVDGGYIHDLSLDNTCCVSSSASYLGGIIGYALNSTVTDLSFAGKTNGYDYLGGVIGYINNSSISDLSNSGNVSGRDYVGGLAGCETAGSNSKFVDSSNTGSVKGRNNVGGVVGYISDTMINVVFNTGNINGNDNVGGVVGNAVRSKVVNVYNTANVVGNAGVAGVVGRSENSGIYNSFNMGNVTANGSTGGIEGYENGTAFITNSYSAGVVIGGITNNTYKGGILGNYNSSTPIISDCYYFAQDGLYGIGKNSSNDGCTACTEAMMKGATGSGSNIVDSLNVYANRINTYGDATLLRWTVTDGYPVFTATVINKVMERWTNYRDTSWYDDAIALDPDEDEFEISSAAQLAGFAYLVNYSNYTFADKTIRLTADIDLDGHYWMPIGITTMYFNGKFDGQGHTISNMTVQLLPGTMTTAKGGLFGYANGGYIVNINLDNTCSVYAGNYVGGVIGTATYSETIDNVSFNGRVEGNDRVGGIVGNGSTAKIMNSYNTGNVIGYKSSVGGIVGYSDASSIVNTYNSGNITSTGNVGGIVGNIAWNTVTSINNSYNVGTVTGGIKSDTYAGGIVGQNNSNTTNTILDCYYLETSADYGIGTILSDEGCARLTDSQMKGLASSGNLIDSLNEYVGNVGVLHNWVGDGVYPTFGTKTIIVPMGTWTWGNNYDTSWYDDAIALDPDEDEFEISTAAELAGLAVIVNGLNGVSAYSFEGKMITLGANIDFSGHLWTPIGVDQTKAFKGTFDGNDKTISNLTVFGLTSANSGLLGRVINSSVHDLYFDDTCFVYSAHDSVGMCVGTATNSTINNVTSAGLVSGRDNTGGIVGTFDSLTLMSDLYSEARVKGRDNTGGIVGNSVAVINEVSFNGSVEGRTNVGGIVGYSKTNNKVINSYNLGEIIGRSSVGGIAGKIEISIITNVYNMGDVSATGWAGGIVGYDYNGTRIANAYNTGLVTGGILSDTYVGGILGRLGSATVTSCYYIDTASKGIGNSDDGTKCKKCSEAVMKGVAVLEDNIVDALNTYAIANSDFVVSAVTYTLNTWVVTDGYPVWGEVVKVYYTAEGASGTIPGPFGYPVGTTGIIVAQGNTIYKADSSFAGWSDGVRVYAAGDVYVMGVGGVTFVAQWSDAVYWTTAGNYDTSWYDPTETETLVYVLDDTIDENTGLVTISAEKKLAGLAVIVNGLNGVTAYNFAGKSIELARSVDLSGFLWTPIGNSSKKFNGLFDGLDNTISNMSVTRSVNYSGLFGYVMNGAVYNLHIGDTCAVYSTADQYTGGLVGYAERSTLFNVSNEGIVSGRYDTGGVAGYSYYSTLINVYNTGSVKGHDRVGGITGAGNNNYVINAYNLGDISASVAIGGIVGWAYGNTHIINAYNTGSTNGNNADRRGAIIGGQTSGGFINVSDAYYLEGTAVRGIGGRADDESVTCCTDETMKGLTGSASNIVDLLNAYVINNDNSYEDYMLFNWSITMGEYPVLVADSVTLTYGAGDGNEWTGDPIAPVVVGAGTLIKLASADSVRRTTDAELYKFLAWKDEDGNYYEADGYVTLTDNLSLTAEFIETSKHVLYYESGSYEAKGVAPDPARVNDGTKVVLEDNTFIRNGYNFNGWAVKDAEGVIDYSMMYLPGYSYPINNDVTMVAVWSSKAMLVIDPMIECGSISVRYTNGDELTYTIIDDERAYYLDAGKTIYVTAAPDAGYKLAAIRYKKDNGAYVIIPSEENVGVLYAESDFHGVYTVSASFIDDSESADPIISVNPEAWYGPISANGTTYQNCVTIYVRVQLPLDNEGNVIFYDNMSIKFTLTRNQVWEVGKKKEFNFKLKQSDFDASGFYYAGLALRRRDLDGADGITADGYIINSQFIFGNNGEDATILDAAHSVEFGLGKQSLSFSEYEINIPMFDDTATTYVISDILSTSGIHKESIKWTSSDTSVATVEVDTEAEGYRVVVTILKQGAEVIIKANAGANNARLLIRTMGINFNDGMHNVESVILVSDGDSVTITPTAINLGEYFKAGYFEYSVDDASVATISASVDGSSVTITPVAVGETFITLTVDLTDDKTLSVKLPVYVTDAGATEITSSVAVVDVGSSVTFTVATEATVTRWEWAVINGASALESTLRIISGGLQAIATGKANGTATVVAIGYNSSSEIVAVAVKDITVIRKE